MKLASTTLSGSLSAFVCTFSHLTAVLAKTYYVSPGQSIQAAIDGTAAGDRVQVAAGTYTENLLIDKNAIDLRGNNVNLIPPMTTKVNYCGGASPDSAVGICVRSSSGDVIRDVSITGFTLTGWRAGILVASYYGSKITQNKIVLVSEYGGDGIALVNGQAAKIQANEVVGGGRGTCISIGPNSKVAQNKLSKCGYALSLTGDGSEAENNDITNSCIGIFFSGKVKISHNSIGTPQADCQTTGSGPAGILTYGGDQPFTVDHNKIENQKGDGQGVAIAVVYNGVGSIVSNTLRNNDANIIFYSGNTNVVVNKNDCKNPETNCNY